MTLYELAGGKDGLLSITRCFYENALADDLIGSMFSRVDPHHADYLADWMSVVFGGPQTYLEQRGDIRFVIYQHMNLRITDAQRARWERLMMDSAAEQGVPTSFLRPFADFVGRITRSVQENSNTPQETLERTLGLEPGEALLPRSDRQ